MNTIDNLMALHDEAAEKRHINGAPVYNAVSAHAREALRTALTEADKEAFARGMAVRKPLAIHHLREIERNHVYNHTATLIEFARQIERAHGIDGDTWW